MSDNYIEKKDREYTIQKEELHANNSLKKLKVMGKNKKIKITTIDENIIRCTLTYMKEYKDCYVLPKIENDIFFIDFNPGKVSDIEILLEIPKYNYDSLIIKNENSSIHVHDISCDKINIYSSNGYIDFEGVSTKIDIATSNGEVNCKLSNVFETDNKINITTTNGSVNLIVPITNNIGYKMYIDNNTNYNLNHNFSSHFELNRVETYENTSVYQTKNYSDVKKRCDFNIKTSNGYVTVK